MPPANPIRIALMLLLFLWGGFQLIGLLRGRDAPTMHRARLLAGLSGILLALWVREMQWTGLPLLLGLGGLGCGAAWLTIIYRQSLHNTTM